jgi:gliding motility-associated-like protein
VYFFKIENGEILHISIMNRWGTIVYETEENSWNGINKNGVNLPSGTYYYIVEYKLFDDTIKTKQGMIQLNR